MQSLDFVLNPFYDRLSKNNIEVSEEEPISLNTDIELKNKYLKVNSDLYVPIGNGVLNDPIHEIELSDGRIVKSGCGVFKSVYTCKEHINEVQRKIPQTCNSMKCKCPACHEAWIKNTEDRLVSEVTSKINALKKLNPKLRVYHYTLSPPQNYALSELQKDRCLQNIPFGNKARYLEKERFGLDKLRHDAVDIIKKFIVKDSLYGGYLIFHSHRETKESKEFNENYQACSKELLGKYFNAPFDMREFYESPHFHIFGIITMDFKKDIAKLPLEDKNGKKIMALNLVTGKNELQFQSNLYHKTNGWFFKMMKNDRSNYKSLRKTISYEISHASFLKNHDNKRGSPDKIPSMDVEERIISIPKLDIEFKSPSVKGAKSEFINYSNGRTNKSLKTIIHFGCFHHSYIKCIDKSTEKPLECPLCSEKGIEDSRLYKIDDLCIERLENNEILIHKIAINEAKDYHKQRRRSEKNGLKGGYSIKSGLITPIHDYSKKYDYVWSTTYMKEKIWKHKSWINKKKLKLVIEQNINSLMFFNKNKSDFDKNVILAKFISKIPKSMISKLRELKIHEFDLT